MLALHPITSLTSHARQLYRVWNSLPVEPNGPIRGVEDFDGEPAASDKRLPLKRLPLSRLQHTTGQRMCQIPGLGCRQSQGRQRKPNHGNPYPR